MGMRYICVGYAVHMRKVCGVGHMGMLAEHIHMLGKHICMLAEHMYMLAEHICMLAEHMGMLAEHMGHDVLSSGQAVKTPSLPLSCARYGTSPIQVLYSF